MALGADVPPYEGTWPSRTRDLAIKNEGPGHQEREAEPPPAGFGVVPEVVAASVDMCLSRNSTPSARVRRTSDEQRSGGSSASALRALIAPCGRCAGPSTSPTGRRASQWARRRRRRRSAGRW